ncbi:substrate-binding domain-containing protein [Verrucomicrobiota bacterium]
MKRITIMTYASRGMLAGIGRYAATRPDWVLDLVRPSPEMLPDFAVRRPDGLIGYLVEPHILKGLECLRIPAVSHSGLLEVSPVSRICVDSTAGGRLAARHFMDKGFKRLACLGFRERTYSTERRDGFIEVLSAKGYSCDVHEIATDQIDPFSRKQGPETDEALCDWLKQLGRPVGLFAVNDDLAWYATEMAREIGVHIPEDVALLGMDNNATKCTFCRPPLSSIESPFQQIGYECCALLDKIMAGEQEEIVDMRVAPSSIAIRQSSDIMAISDDTVASAARFIRENVTRDITMDDVARAAGVAFSRLGALFDQELGRTPEDELRRRRLQHVEALLLSTDLSIDDIAAASGFRTPQALSEAFNKKHGTTPEIYRINSRAAPSSELGTVDYESV